RIFARKMAEKSLFFKSMHAGHEIPDTTNMGQLSHVSTVHRRLYEQLRGVKYYIVGCNRLFALHVPLRLAFMSIAPFGLPQEPEYAWEVATLFPVQGRWSEAEYFDLTDTSKRRIEFADGRLEFLPMPTVVHESLVRFLFLALFRFVELRQLGEVF